MVRVRALAKRLIEIPGVVAVTLGDSRGLLQPDTEWGFGLYYRDAIRAEDVRASVSRTPWSSRGTGDGSQTAAAS